MQEIWATAYLQRLHFANRGSLEGWLRRIARGVAIDWTRARQRSRRRMPSFDLDYGALVRPALDVDTAIESGLETQRICDWVDDQIVRLLSLQLRVAAMRWLLGHSTSQTAEELRIAPGTVKAALHQAREKLRAQWQRGSPDAEGDAHRPAR